MRSLILRNISIVTAVLSLGAALSVTTARGQILVTNGSTVGEYDATTGAVLNAPLVSGLSTPYSLAVSGPYLFVVNQGTGTIGEYTATGAVVNASLVSGLSAPTGVAVSGPNLYVASGSTIAEYNATTGAVVNASLVSGLSGPWGIAVSGSNLFVTNENTGTIGEYTTTGEMVNAVAGLGVEFARLALPCPDRTCLL